MRTFRPLAVAALLVAGATSDAQDRPAETKEPPAQDAVGVAALRRVGELVHSPGVDGVREMSCAVEAPGMENVVAAVRLRWTVKSFDAEVRRRAGLPPSDAVTKAVNLLRFKVSMPFLVQGFFDPAHSLDRSRVESEERDDGLHVVTTATKPNTLGGRLACELDLRHDGLPATLELGFTGASGSVRSDPGRMKFGLAFDDDGTRKRLARMSLILEDKEVPCAAITYFAEAAPTPLPRRLEWTPLRGGTEIYLLHDFVVDGKPIAGTSLPEALAGRRRRVDPAAQACFDRFDAALASLHASGARTASCRVHFATAMVDGVLPVSLGPEGIDDGPVELTAKRGSDTDVADFVAGFRIGVRRGLGKALLPPSAQWDGFDARLDPATGHVDLEPLDPAAPEERMTLQFDDRGLVVRVDTVLKPAGDEVTTIAQYERRGSRYVRVHETATGAVESTSRVVYADDPAWPGVFTRTIIAITAGQIVGTYDARFADWVIDGRPVPGTNVPDADELPGAPPEAPDGAK